MRIDRVTAPVGCAFSKKWQLLGPFPIGTREATWGADPVEAFGEIRGIDGKEHVSIPSPLGKAGSVTCSEIVSEAHESTNAATCKLAIAFPDVDWDSLRSVYGWAALQWQGWASGSINIIGPDEQTVTLNMRGILEFWVDDDQFFGGDYYSFDRAPTFLHLSPGTHVLNLRLIRDLRVLGGIGRPDLELRLKATLVPNDVHLVCSNPILPDCIDGKFASGYGTIRVTNSSTHKIRVCEVQAAGEASDLDTNFVSLPIHADGGWIICPGQSRPLNMRLQYVEDLKSRLMSRIWLRIVYYTAGSSETNSISTSAPMSRKALTEMHRITFPGPGGSVSYALLRPPLRELHSDQTQCEEAAPIFLFLHGAGVDILSGEMEHLFEELLFLPVWLLIPFGGSTWGGDDWHTYGFANVEAAISAIPVWISANRWSGSGVDTNSWLVTGHSNGGQGVWYALTHKPNKIIAAAPVSGYSSIQGYVPYSMWSEADSSAMAIIESSLSSWKHETLLENCNDKAIHIQHGSSDDNVPVFHSRKMWSISQSNRVRYMRYTELPGEGHWFEGVMTTPALMALYKRVLKDYHKEHRKPAGLPPHFKLIVPKAFGMGAMAGLSVDALQDPTLPGCLEVRLEENGSQWTLKTTNIAQFHWEACVQSNLWPSTLVFDLPSVLQPFPIPDQIKDWLLGHHFVYDKETQRWTVFESNLFSQGIRQSPPQGPLEAILNSPGSFTIQYDSESAAKTVLQISRNLFQYFGADTQLLQYSKHLPTGKGNVISVFHGHGVPHLEDPLRGIFLLPCENDLKLCLNMEYGPAVGHLVHDSVGAIFVAPLGTNRLEATIWGIDDDGLTTAARLFPMLTGVGQPAFIVTSHASASRGISGILAMGYFTDSWKVSHLSYLSTGKWEPATRT